MDSNANAPIRMLPNFKRSNNQCCAVAPEFKFAPLSSDDADCARPAIVGWSDFAASKTGGMSGNRIAVCATHLQGLCIMVALVGIGWEYVFSGYLSAHITHTS